MSMGWLSIYFAPLVKENTMEIQISIFHYFVYFSSISSWNLFIFYSCLIIQDVGQASIQFSLNVHHVQLANIVKL